MIEIEVEHLVPLHDVPSLLPPRTSGKRIHISAVYRWTQKGIRGTRLEVIRIGGTTYTSREALQRFATPSVIANKTSCNAANRIRQIEAAARKVEDLLGLRKSICR